MIPRNLSGLLVAIVCAPTLFAVAHGQSTISGTWEIKKLAFEVPTAISSGTPDGGLARVRFDRVIASDILVIDSQDSKPKSSRQARSRRGRLMVRSLPLALARALGSARFRSSTLTAPARSSSQM
jgi:hypothetical protein